MAITHIKISKYKNIRNLDLDLEDSNMSLIIGKNGSGKSNFLEAILLIFKTLYTFDIKGCEFDFTISLTSKDDSKVTFVKTKEAIYLNDRQYSNRGKSFMDKKSYIDTVFQYKYLPQNIIMYYLGDNKRLYAIAKSISRSNKVVEVNRYDYNTNSIILVENEVQIASLIALYLCNDMKHLDFIIDSISVSVQHSYLSVFQESLLSEYVEKIDSSNKGRDVIVLRSRKADNITLVALTNEIVRLFKLKILSQFIETEEYSVNLTITNKMKSFNVEKMNFRELSEGEQNRAIINSFAYVYDGEHDNSIFILDEPDAFLNPVWQNNLTKSLKKRTKNQVFICSHSSNIISRVNNDEVVYFDKGKARKLGLNVYGRDIRFIQQYIQDVPRFPGDVQWIIDEFFSEIDKKNIEEAGKHLKRLEDIFGSDDPYYTELATIHEFEGMLTDD